ncbi:MAG: hypothetical protein PHY02_06485 [Phycisphaerae bacterium]|nr:hypothetical protein [Phycisphaerae bacterium]
MDKKKPVFLTDGKGGIFKITKLIKAAVLLNLETGQSYTAEINGSNVTGFAAIDMPTIKDVPSVLPETTGDKQRKSSPEKIKKGLKSHFYGVSWNAKTKKWRTGFHPTPSTFHRFGEFQDETEAAKAVDAELEKRGLPKRNFP